MSSSGSYYSWTNKSIWSRIDRAFINSYWHDQFDFTQSRYLAMGLSDHTSLLIHLPTAPKPLPSFQFYDIWCAHKDFQSIITAPKLTSSSTHKIQQLWEFLSHLRPPFRKLNKDKFRDLKQAPADRGLQQTERELRITYANIISSSISLMRQRCILEWIEHGDDCSRLFFAKAKQRKLATYIYTLKDDAGNTVEGFDAVGRVMVNFYKSLLGSQTHPRTPLNPAMLNAGPLLSMEQQLALCRPFTDQEIKEALFSIPSYKSPGPYGYNSGFFKSTSNHTGHMVCEAVKEFFNTGFMRWYLSATKLIVLPKVSYPQTACEFRPISAVMFSINAFLSSSVLN
ncbi:hypothetical protein Cgig2_013226 [Carnegiea gigantea]|uniref:Reverse transcriptase n=1 Tax=Carnegiea gigantea TaxID=171969 RepID=A0A9Q1JJE0_9CARY|nr:hypothetical protein Cgig2_013226 [Carnegiea gigantea]